MPSCVIDFQHSQTVAAKAAGHLDLHHLAEGVTKLEREVAVLLKRMAASED
jgi:hypothetical protein